MSFLAIFPESGQTREHCFLAMFSPTVGRPGIIVLPSHASQRWANQETLFPMSLCLNPSHVS
jgi:hypothetical protein